MQRKKALAIAALTISGLLWPLTPSPTAAHSGRTNSSGCHNNRRTGDYHCHNSGSTPRRQSPVTPAPAPTRRRIQTPPAVSAPPSNYWRVLSIGDGDTLRISKGSETASIRLACIDAPEIAQAYGQEARAQLQALLPIGTPVSMRTVDTDRYERTVAELFSQGRNINLSLIQSGHAVAYRQYLSNCDSSTYLNAEANAQQSRRAFWSQSNPVMPWDFRRQQ